MRLGCKWFTPAKTTCQDDSQNPTLIFNLRDYAVNFLQNKREYKKETPYRMVRGFVIGLCWLFPPLLLALLHPGPVEKAIAVVDQEHDKADDHGQVRKVLCGG